MESVPVPVSVCEKMTAFSFVSMFRQPSRGRGYSTVDRAGFLALLLLDHLVIPGLVRLIRKE